MSEIEEILERVERHEAFSYTWMADAQALAAAYREQRAALMSARTEVAGKTSRANEYARCADEMWRALVDAEKHHAEAHPDCEVHDD